MSDWIKACMKSNVYIWVLFLIVSAMTHLSYLDEAVGNRGFDSSLKHTLAFSLSNPLWLFYCAFKASLTGIISSDGSVTSKVPLSKRPFISFLIALPHFSWTCLLILNIWDSEFGKRKKPDRFIAPSWHLS